jgi:hypothetical protein
MSGSVDQARALRDEDAFDICEGRCVPQAAHRWPSRHTDGQAVSGRRIQPDVSAQVSGPRTGAAPAAQAGAKAKSAHDMLREAHIMAALKPHYAYVPAILATCDDESVIGQHFYVMERLRGIILRRDCPAGLDAPGDVAHLVHGFVDRLIELHQVDAEPGAAVHRQGRRLYRAPSQRLERSLASGTHRRHRCLRRRARMARGKTAVRDNASLRHPQRLPFRQRGARSRTATATSSACSIGNWPRSAIR